MPMAVRAETMVQLTEELVGRLDDEAARRGVSRSAVIREAVTAYLAEAAASAAGRRIVEGYTRVPPATPDAWGDLEDQQERSQRELLQRLDAEERRSGKRPW